MRKFLAVFLGGILILAQGVMTFASSDVDTKEQYEMVENTEWVPTDVDNNASVSPCTLYIADIYTSIVKVSSTQVSIQAQTICSETVKSIKVTYI